eukprot:m.65101 g.65101  ORF g.65101 m.65101 type:complete len:50 (+) comp12046_c0_seq1:301-450(+)
MRANIEGGSHLTTAEVEGLGVDEVDSVVVDSIVVVVVVDDQVGVSPVGT